MPAAIKLCCKGGSEANTGGTGCRTEWGKMNRNIIMNINPDYGN